MKRLALIIAISLALSGCAIFKDIFGGQANVPAGFEVTHVCTFFSPQAVVVGFRLLTVDHASDRCGTVAIDPVRFAQMSKAEMAEYVFSQLLAGAFTPCKEKSDAVSNP